MESYKVKIWRIFLHIVSEKFVWLLDHVLNDNLKNGSSDQRQN